MDAAVDPNAFLGERLFWVGESGWKMSGVITGPGSDDSTFSVEAGRVRTSADDPWREECFSKVGRDLAFYLREDALPK